MIFFDIILVFFAIYLILSAAIQIDKQIWERRNLIDKRIWEQPNLSVTKSCGCHKVDGCGDNDCRE